MASTSPTAGQVSLAGEGDNRREDAQQQAPQTTTQQIRVQKPEDDDSNDDGSNGHSDGPSTPTLPPICSPASYNPLLLHQNKSNPFSSFSSTTTSASSSASSPSKPLLRPSAFKLLQDPANNTPASPSSTVPLQQQQPQPSTTPFVLRPSKLLASSGGGKEAGGGASASAPQPKAVQNIQFVPLEKEDERKEDECGREDRGGSSSSSGGGGVEGNPKEPPAEFVFGKNLSDRVLDSGGGCASASASGGGGSGGGAVKRKVDDDAKNEEVKKRVLDEKREVITGEENEVNVLQLGCRLFIFDPQKSSWVERGRGLLRLNDSKPDDKNASGSGSKTSRLIIRTKGSLRVMLNTKVWEGMRVEKAGDKSLKILACDLEASSNSNNSNCSSEDDRGLRIFLIMLTSMSDAFTLTSELTLRVQKLVQDQQPQQKPQ